MYSISIKVAHGFMTCVCKQIKVRQGKWNHSRQSAYSVHVPTIPVLKAGHRVPTVYMYPPSQFSRLGTECLSVHVPTIPVLKAGHRGVLVSPVCIVLVLYIGSGFSFFSSVTTNLASVLYTCIFMYIHVLPGICMCVATVFYIEATSGRFLQCRSK